MKSIKGVLNFCKDFTFDENYNIEKVIDLNLVRDCVISILNECDLIEE